MEKVTHNPTIHFRISDNRIIPVTKLSDADYRIRQGASGRVYLERYEQSAWTAINIVTTTGE